MNTNAVADELLNYLETKHSRVYRNKTPASPKFPYIVFRIDSATDTSPSSDMYANIDIYEGVDISVRAIEDLADNIDGDGKIFDENNIPKEPTGLNHKVINTEVLNLQFENEQRQYVPAEELVSKQLINLRYVVRAYFK